MWYILVHHFNQRTHYAWEFWIHHIYTHTCVCIVKSSGKSLEGWDMKCQTDKQSMDPYTSGRFIVAWCFPSFLCGLLKNCTCSYVYCARIVNLVMMKLWHWMKHSAQPLSMAYHRLVVGDWELIALQCCWLILRISRSNYFFLCTFVPGIFYLVFIQLRYLKCSFDANSGSSSIPGYEASRLDMSTKQEPVRRVRPYTSISQSNSLCFLPF